MQVKHRSYPPAKPLKLSKMLQYEYFTQIYEKQIFSYFSQIVTTDKLETLRFIYVPIENPNKVANIQLGVPFSGQLEAQNSNLSNEVTCIKITYQTHVIFEYLMNLNLVGFNMHRLQFQDKFWLFTEGILRNYHFNDIVFKRQTKLQQQVGIHFILEGEFRCFKSSKKAFKTIGRGFIIDLDGKLRKVKFQGALSHIASLKDSQNTSAKKGVRRQDNLTEQQMTQDIQVLLSNSNNAKILFLDWNVVRKYVLNLDEVPGAMVSQNITGSKSQSLDKDQAVGGGVRKLMKFRRFKTEKSENISANAFNIQHQRVQKNKSSLMSCRSGNSIGKKMILDPIQLIFNNEILRQYTKDNDLYKKIKKQNSQAKHKRFLSNLPKQEKEVRKQHKLLSFFKRQMLGEKQKVNIKRRKTRQIWRYTEGKENFFEKTRKFMQQIQKNHKQNSTIHKTNSASVRKLSKPQVSSFQLLRRNLFNKEYHKTDFVQFRTQ